MPSMSGWRPTCRRWRRAGHIREVVIHQDQVGAHTGGQGHAIFAGVGHTDDLDLPAAPPELAERFRQHDVVVDDDDSGLVRSEHVVHFHRTLTASARPAGG
jgi:hypothetical protein